MSSLICISSCDLSDFGFAALPTIGTMYATSVSSLYFAIDNLLDMIDELPVKVCIRDPCGGKCLFHRVAPY